MLIREFTLERNRIHVSSVVKASVRPHIFTHIRGSTLGKGHTYAMSAVKASARDHILYTIKESTLEEICRHVRCGVAFRVHILLSTGNYRIAGNYGKFLQNSEASRNLPMQVSSIKCCFKDSNSLQTSDFTGKRKPINTVNVYVSVSQCLCERSKCPNFQDATQKNFKIHHKERGLINED